MLPDIIKRIGLLVLFVLIQALVLGRIHLFDCATPLFYVYFVLLYPRNTARWLGLVLAFILGLCIDMFTNTPGVSAFSLTLVAFIQPYLLELYLDRETADDFSPSIKTMGWLKYSTYALFLVLVFCTSFFSLEAFSMYDWMQWVLCVTTSFALTYITIMIVDSARGK